MTDHLHRSSTSAEDQWSYLVNHGMTYQKAGDDSDIRYVEHTENGRGEAVNPGSPLNSSEGEYAGFPGNDTEAGLRQRIGAMT